MLCDELRNPLAPIRNANEVLRQKADDLTRVHWVQGVIDRQLTHLVRLVDDLLDVSRLTQGKIRLEFEEVELGEVIAPGCGGRSASDRIGTTMNWTSRFLPIRSGSAPISAADAGCYQPLE